jgi:hypothetical protein
MAPSQLFRGPLRTHPFPGTTGIKKRQPLQWIELRPFAHSLNSPRPG